MFTNGAATPRYLPERNEARVRTNAAWNRRFIHNSPESDTERTDMGNMIQPFGGNKNQPPIHPALQTSPKTVVLSKRLRHGRLQTAWSRSRDVPEKAKL